MNEEEIVEVAQVVLRREVPGSLVARGIEARDRQQGRTIRLMSALRKGAFVDQSVTRAVRSA
jgi:hypothetical protein